jgi:hypothetical protein
MFHEDKTEVYMKTATITHYTRGEKEIPVVVEFSGSGRELYFENAYPDTGKSSHERYLHKYWPLIGEKIIDDAAWKVF